MTFVVSHGLSSVLTFLKNAGVTAAFLGLPSVVRGSAQLPSTTVALPTAGATVKDRTLPLRALYTNAVTPSSPDG